MHLKYLLAFAALALAAPQHRDGNYLPNFSFEYLLIMIDRDHGRGGRTGLGDALGGIAHGAGDLIGGITNGIDRCINRPGRCLRH
jgi:hypothetical protein